VLLAESEKAPWQVIGGRNRFAAMARLVDGEGMIVGAIAAGNYYEAPIDPRAFAKSANELRRHLRNRAQKRKAIVQALKAYPEKSDRAIAGETGPSHPTVATAREALKQTGDVVNIPGIIYLSPLARIFGILRQLSEKHRWLKTFSAPNLCVRSSPAPN
jgi:hypothetical protein